MNSDLPIYLRESAARAFAWGECDCCTWACDWVAQVIGVDPARRWRGACASAIEAARILKEGGGMLALAQAAFADVGLAETDDPLPGDVGVVLGSDGETMAIRTRIGWAVKTRDGVGCGPFATLAAWRIECPPR